MSKTIVAGQSIINNGGITYNDDGSINYNLKNGEYVKLIPTKNNNLVISTEKIINIIHNGKTKSIIVPESINNIQYAIAIASYYDGIIKTKNENNILSLIIIINNSLDIDDIISNIHSRAINNPIGFVSSEYICIECNNAKLSFPIPKNIKDFWNYLIIIFEINNNYATIKITIDGDNNNLLFPSLVIEDTKNINIIY
jgi:hypothetical protein